MSQSPEERALLIEAIVERARAEKEFTPISEEAYRLWDERDRAIDIMDSATNRQERESAGRAFLVIHKAFLRALGMKPCFASDCTKYLTGRQTRYCSVECRTKDKSRKWRADNPEASRRSLMSYLESLPKSDLRKPVKRKGKPK